ncbi:MAG TPA: SDR family oxidoreductase [Polyangiaceae bacterium]|nr:SDR family oxidoreductase [Polyangiaceae bacterium]
MSIYQFFASKGPSGFGYGSTAEQVTAGLSLRGKTILVTGCNSGLGLETTRVLALRGARVAGTARTREKAEAACNPVKGETLPFACELSDPASVYACIAAVKAAGLKLDAIICNAGIMALPKLEKAHGYEQQFFTNHVGHFILVTGLLDELTESGRVVMLSSDMHKRAPKGGIEFDNLDGSKGYDGLKNYSQSKFANVLFAKELARRFNGTKRTANAVHPGVIATNLGRHMNPVLWSMYSALAPLLLKTVPQGAATEMYVATNPALDGVSGEYFADSNVAKARRDTNDTALAQKLWEVSEKIVANLPKN